MTNIEIAQKILGVSKEKAKELIEEKGLDVDFLMNGYTKSMRQELGDISDKFKTNVDDIIKQK